MTLNLLRMFLTLRRFILARWTSFMLHVSTLWGFLLFQQQDPLHKDTANAQADHNTTNNFPPTEEQLEERIKKFIDSLDEDAICRLASQHNGQKPCRVVGRDRGSFNVCFFIHFDQDGVRWVVRIPLEPVVQNAWEKVQSEVTTMRYLQCNTTIPIPRIHAYGQDAGLAKGHSTKPFLICDHVAGHPLNMRMLAKAAKEQRMRFYDDLIDILAQLYQPQFSVAGSLIASAHNEADPAVGGLLSMAANELGRCCQEEGDIKTFTSARQYMDYQYRVLSKTYSLPTEELSRKQAQMELFALDSLEKQIPVLASSQRANDPFVLAHMDLRCGNIMVTEDLHILAIIDWEFAGTIPRQLFTPPPWITGHDLDAVAAVPHYTAYPEFLQVLEEKSSTSQTCAKLRDDWKSLPDLAFPIAQILRHPSCLIRVYYKFIFPKLYDGEKGSVVPEFFERQDIVKSLGVEVARRVEESSRYTQYLKDQGLFVINEQEQANQKWLAKVERLRNSIE